MASVYILFSEKLNRFYTGSCLDLHSDYNRIRIKVLRIVSHLRQKIGNYFSL